MGYVFSPKEKLSFYIYLSKIYEHRPVSFLLVSIAALRPRDRLTLCRSAAAWEFSWLALVLKPHLLL